MSSVQAEETAGPWLLHPLRPPSRLSVNGLRIHLDYRERIQPGFVVMQCEADLKNDGNVALDEQLLMVCGDSGSRLLFNGKEVPQERLVMPLPGSKTGAMTRVSIFRLVLLAGERGHLKFKAQQRLDFLSATRHSVHLVMPVHRAWNQVGDSLVKIDLAPELHLLHPESFTNNQRRLSSYVKSTQIEVEAVVLGPPWAGALGAVPALRRAWLWGGLASLVGVTLGALGRRTWLLALPTALLVNWGLRKADPTLLQWTYYRDAVHYQTALSLQHYFVALWTVCGTLGGMVLGYHRKGATGPHGRS
ncbi:hypothetical protein IV102_26070 [bacterium]|nr:hypothetical protein [bacterium]